MAVFDAAVDVAAVFDAAAVGKDGILTVADLTRVAYPSNVNPSPSLIPLCPPLCPP